MKPLSLTLTALPVLISCWALRVPTSALAFESGPVGICTDYSGHNFACGGRGDNSGSYRYHFTPQTPPSPPQPSPEEMRAQQAVELNDEGVELAKSGNREAALSKYQEALRLNPNNTVARQNLAIDEAELAFQAGNYGSAIARLRAAIALGRGNLGSRLADFQREQRRVEAQRRAEERQLAIAAHDAALAASYHVVIERMRSEPPVPTVTSTSGSSRALLEAAGEKLDNARIWYGDPEHRQWVDDAVGIATAPMIAESALTSLGKAIEGKLASALGALGIEYGKEKAVKKSIDLLLTEP